MFVPVATLAVYTLFMSSLMYNFVQVVTLAVYTFFMSSLMGRQFLDPEKNLEGHEVEIP